MKNTSRVLAMLLALMMLLSTLASCAGDKDDKNSATQTATDALTETSEPVETDAPLAKLEVSNLNGHEVRILWPEPHTDGHFIHNEIDADSTNGDIINDAVFKRNCAVEEAYNVTITSVLQFCSTIPKTLRTEYMAQAPSSYDALCTNIAFMSPIALEGVLADFKDLKYYSEDQQWWNHSLMQDYSIANKRYFGSGDIIYSDDFYPYCFFVNNNVKADVGISDNLFDSVRNKTWTLDKMLEYSKAAVRELDGDGKHTVNDGQGLTLCSSFSTAVYYSAGKGEISLDSAGYPTWEMTTEHTSDICDKLHTLIFTDNAAWVADSGQIGGLNHAEVMLSLFNNNKTLFTSAELIFAERIARSENGVQNYSILPMPLYDENSEYICMMNDAVVVSIPVLSEDVDRTSLILSAMSRESVNTLTPAFFETVLTARYMQDEDSVDMLNTILSSERAKDVATIQDWGAFTSGFKALVESGSTDFASFYQTRIKLATKLLNNYVTSLEKLGK